LPEQYENDPFVMKIGLLVPSLGLDGNVSTPAVRLLVAHLAQHASVHVYPLRFPPAGPDIIADGAVVHPLGSQRLRFRALAGATIRTLWREHRKQPFDLLHGLWLHEPGTLAVLAGSVLRVPVVASIGGA
jgi:hypothetical protein